MVCQLLDKYPHLRGKVLERPEVISDRTRLWAHRMGISDRSEYVAGNMFESVPDADTYIMKLILHDWNDDECVQILQKQHRQPSWVAAPSLWSMPSPPRLNFSKLFDIQMMCGGTGRERTQEEKCGSIKEGWLEI